MIIAGKTYDVSFADGTIHRIKPTLSDETRYERQTKTSLMKYITTDGEPIPAFVLVELVHIRLQRDGVDVPDDLEAFEDSLAEYWLELVDEGKAEGSAPDPTTG